MEEHEKTLTAEEAAPREAVRSNHAIEPTAASVPLAVPSAHYGSVAAHPEH